MKKIINHDQVGFIPGFKVGLTHQALFLLLIHFLLCYASERCFLKKLFNMQTTTYFSPKLKSTFQIARNEYLNAMFFQINIFQDKIEIKNSTNIQCHLYACVGLRGRYIIQFQLGSLSLNLPKINDICRRSPTKRWSNTQKSN